MISGESRTGKGETFVVFVSFLGRTEEKVKNRIKRLGSEVSYALVLPEGKDGLKERFDRKRGKNRSRRLPGELTPVFLASRAHFQKATGKVARNGRENFLLPHAAA